MAYKCDFCGYTLYFQAPFFPGLDFTFYTITVVAAILIRIPIGLALFFWSINPPKSDVKKRED